MLTRWQMSYTTRQVVTGTLVVGNKFFAVAIIKHMHNRMLAVNGDAEAYNGGGGDNSESGVIINKSSS